EVKNEKQQENKNILETRVASRSDLKRYNNGISKNYRYFGPRLSYNSLRAGDYFATVLNEVERNRGELTEEERNLFLRNIIRQTSLKNNKAAYDRIFNMNYYVASNRIIT